MKRVRPLVFRVYQVYGILMLRFSTEGEMKLKDYLVRFNGEVPVGKGDLGVDQLQTILKHHRYHWMRDAEPESVWWWEEFAV